MGLTQASAMPTFFAHLSIRAKAIFTSEIKGFCHCRHDFQICGVCTEGDSTVELEALGGPVVGGGVRENCEHSRLVFRGKKCQRCHRLIDGFLTPGGNTLRQLHPYGWDNTS